MINDFNTNHDYDLFLISSGVSTNFLDGDDPSR